MTPDERRPTMFTRVKASLLRVPTEDAADVTAGFVVAYLLSSSARQRSLSTGLRANVRLAAAERFRDEGRAIDALAEGRRGLDILSDPAVRRLAPFEGTVLIALTRLVEELAEGGGQVGARLGDLRDCLRFIERLSFASERFSDLKKRRPESVGELIAVWRPRLEARIRELSGQP